MSSILEYIDVGASRPSYVKVKYFLRGILEYIDVGGLHALVLRELNICMRSILEYIDV